MKSKKIFWIILILINSALSDDKKYFTGNPEVDMFDSHLSLNNLYTPTQDSHINARLKSPFLAGGLSLLAPGAGEIYSGSYLKAGLFIAVEVAAWVYGFKYEKQGDDQTTFFQNYADGRIDLKPSWDINEPDRYRTRWDVIRYYEWSYANKSIINPQGDYSNISNAIVSSDITLPPWQRIDWESLNALERAIGKWYSHTLHYHGEQQYYELIGKYPQYNQGWFDAENPNFTYGDQLSQAFKEYSRMRGLANDYYYKAKTAFTVVLVNHVISALDAYFTTRSYNSRIRLEAKMHNQETYYGNIPAAFLNLRYNF